MDVQVVKLFWGVYRATTQKGFIKTLHSANFHYCGKGWGRSPQKAIDKAVKNYKAEKAYQQKRYEKTICHVTL